MGNELKKYLSNFLPLPSEDLSIIREVIKELNFNIPQDYIDFLSEVDGGEGAIGRNSYLILWPSRDLLTNNADYNTASFANDYFLIGQDAADTAYGIKKSDGMIYEFGFLANLNTDPPKRCGTNFFRLYQVSLFYLNAAK
jgi:hypothetical protein